MLGRASGCTGDCWLWLRPQRRSEEKATIAPHFPCKIPPHFMILGSPTVIHGWRLLLWGQI